MPENQKLYNTNVKIHFYDNNDEEVMKYTSENIRTFTLPSLPISVDITEHYINSVIIESYLGTNADYNVEMKEARYVSKVKYDFYDSYNKYVYSLVLNGTTVKGFTLEDNQTRLGILQASRQDEDIISYKTLINYKNITFEKE